MIAVPVFSGGVRVAWMVASAHMINMGGLQFGSCSPLATECYQEAIRLPPVRLYRKGEEQHDIWDILRNNIRVPDLVEMDMRALIAGCHVAAEKLIELIGELNDAARFASLAEGMNSLLDAELARAVWVRSRQGTAAPPAGQNGRQSFTNCPANWPWLMAACTSTSRARRPNAAIISIPSRGS